MWRLLAIYGKTLPKQAANKFLFTSLQMHTPWVHNHHHSWNATLNIYFQKTCSVTFPHSRVLTQFAKSITKIAWRILHVTPISYVKLPDKTSWWHSAQSVVALEPFVVRSPVLRSCIFCRKFFKTIQAWRPMICNEIWSIDETTQQLRKMVGQIQY